MKQSLQQRPMVCSRSYRMFCSNTTNVAPKQTREPLRKYIALPSILYSTSKADISVRQLKRLYRAVCKANTVVGSPTKEVFFEHWEHAAGSGDLKLQLLLDKSVAVCAAYVRGADIYDPDEDGHDESVSSPDAGSQLWGGWAWRQPRQLVGFVRAAGDSALVATIHDCLIHPDLQGFGLGSVLIKRIVQQVAAEDVYDVGLVTPSSLQSFFRSCSFELDHEESVPMALQGPWTKDVEAINAPLQSSSLQELLRTAIIT